MGLPINIDGLLNGSTVEWARLECKEGWNPEAVLHTMCAFANDLHNWGGGYIVLGLSERDGRPVLPPSGLATNQVDKIQKELLNLCNLMSPKYFPVVEPVVVSGRRVVVIWVPGGENRPYKAPQALSKGAAMAYYVRVGSTSVKATGPLEQELLHLAAKVPFDDRINHHAAIDALSRRLIQGHLAEVRSGLADEAASLELVQLGRQMRIISGADENPRPLNVGLLFFTDEPHRFLDTAWIDVVHMPQGPSGLEIRESRFAGPLDQQLRSALEHIRGRFIDERTLKRGDTAEVERYFTYPYAAVEEALANAVYHRGYDVREPTEVLITPTEITVTSYPGPDPSVRVDALKTGRVVARRYRNRRVGEFLKELRLTEGRGTGIPTILRAMRENGSPEPSFETDSDRSFFTTRLPLHPLARPATEQVTEQVTEQAEVASSPIAALRQVVPASVNPDIDLAILEYAKTPRSRADLQAESGLKQRPHFTTNHLAPLLNAGLLEYTVPESPRAPNQKYRTTAKGLKVLQGKGS